MPCFLVNYGDIVEEACLGRVTKDAGTVRGLTPSKSQRTASFGTNTSLSGPMEDALYCQELH